MTYKVIINPEAARDAEQAYLYVSERAPDTAVRWYHRMLDAMFSLEDFPGRFPLAPESKYLKKPVRHLIFGNYRILYSINQQRKVVRILHVRHAARRALGDDSPDSRDE